MTDTEQYLKEHWYATKSIGRLLIDLSLAKSAYQQSYDEIAVSCDVHILRTRQRRRNLSPVERTAVIVVDHYRAEVESIEKRLAEERVRIRDIEQAVKDACFNAREAAYVRLRYFENRSVTAVSQRMFCSIATCGRLRESALKKIEAAMQKKDKMKWQGA
ncbi:MAG: hypothetical protein ACOX8Q_04390 [Christensenellales bacterium]|jgi:DNA-directed RNA polymerase specialized sigma24 family protein